MSTIQGKRTGSDWLACGDLTSATHGYVTARATKTATTTTRTTTTNTTTYDYY